MDDQLRIAIAQYDIAWENPRANRVKIEELLKQNGEHFDLLVLPEMFTTGFSMNTSQIAENSEGATLTWMKRLAKEQNAYVTGSVVIEEGGNFYNRLFWVDQNGSFEIYDKKHLFTLAKEDRHFTAGSEKLIVDITSRDGSLWKVCPLICYDLRFPVWSRNAEDYDLLIYVANFPEKRRYAWRQLLIARAIENQCYIIGVNRIGEDGIKIPYSGDSLFIGYDGEIIADAESKEGIFVQAISKNKLAAYRRAYNFLADRDDFSIT